MCNNVTTVIEEREREQCSSVYCFNSSDLPLHSLRLKTIMIVVLSIMIYQCVPRFSRFSLLITKNTKTFTHFKKLVSFLKRIFLGLIVGQKLLIVLQD